ncbi:MAG: dihydrofolate reductase [Marinilabiliaceae bacterium]
MIDRFADIKILRYHVDGFEKLPLERKVLLFHLSEAALWGRDIYWHQNCADGLRLRKLVEAVYSWQRDHGCLDERMAEYAKRLWFANGPYHHYSNDKFRPDFSADELSGWAAQAGADALLDEEMQRLIFDHGYKAKKVSLDTSGDIVADSSVNFYQDGISQQEVAEFYKAQARHPLNSQVVKGPDGKLSENVWMSGGMYGQAIDRVIYHLAEAKRFACNELQVKAISQLIGYYESGDPDGFDEFNKTWVADKQSDVDFINGFIEVYDDPMGLKGTWESIVELQDAEATRQIELIAANAQWFEDHSPVDPAYRKSQVSGVSMKVIDAVMLGGDCYPSTPIGVNLPNADWIREQFGSKSISLANITHALHEEAQQKDQSRPSVLAEFAFSDEEKERSRRYGRVSDDLHTQLHECLGHGSGQMRPGVSLDDLGAYGSAIEEARADLFALYFMADPKMVELGIVDSYDVAWAHYDSYLRGGLLVQLARIEEGRDIEEAHMRNRAMISRWVLERGQDSGAVSWIEKDGRHYVSIADYQCVRRLFAELLSEVQRIKSEGDYEGAKRLIETYGVKIDPALHAEVRARYASLGIAPFSGFVNPVLSLVYSEGEVSDVAISYDEAYDDQMLRYSADYSALA